MIRLRGKAFDRSRRILIYMLESDEGVEVTLGYRNHETESDGDQRANRQQ